MSLNNISENENSFEDQNGRKTEINETLSNVEPLTHNKIKNSRILLFQIIASTVPALFHLTAGISSGIPTVLLNQIEFSDPTNFEILQQTNWTAVALIFSEPLGGIIGAFLIDSIGRLNTIKLSLVPAVIGWVIVVAFKSAGAIIVGQIMTGLAIAWSTYPAIVYITEIARPDIRGSVLSIGPVFLHIGVFLIFPGELITSLTALVAITAGCFVLPFVCLFFIPESPPWLTYKGRNDQAKKALKWFTKNSSLAELQFQNLIEERKNQWVNTGFFAKIKEIFKPSGYKPMLILLGLLVFQQFSSIYLPLVLHSTVLMDQITANINLELFSKILSGLNIVFLAANIFLLKMFGRRTLIIYGSISVAACIVARELFTYLVIKDTTLLSSVLNLTFFFLCWAVSKISLESVPWTMIAELFPIQIRGPAYCIVYSVAKSLTLFSHFFLNLNSDPDRTYLVLLLVVVSLLGSVYAYVFLPETHGVELSNIKDYFEHGCVYIK